MLRLKGKKCQGKKAGRENDMLCCVYKKWGNKKTKKGRWTFSSEFYDHIASADEVEINVKIELCQQAPDGN